MLIFPGLLANVLFFFCGNLAKSWRTLGFFARILDFSKILCQNLTFPRICRWEIELFGFPPKNLLFLCNSCQVLYFTWISCRVLAFSKILCQNLVSLAFSLRNSSFVWFLANSCLFVGLLARILILIRFFVRFGYLKDLF